MAKSKGTYSLISVDVAPDEEVVRVDAKGVHREEPASGVHIDGQYSGETAHEAGSASESSASSADARKPRAAHAKKADESDSYDGRDDLNGPVPMANMQRVIIAAVVVCLVAFVVYYVVLHGQL